MSDQKVETIYKHGGGTGEWVLNLVGGKAGVWVVFPVSPLPCCPPAGAQSGAWRRRLSCEPPAAPARTTRESTYPAGLLVLFLWEFGLPCLFRLMKNSH